mmetsp:Transcript_62132/g.144546  ORF Transcript_62132/g.144546 Transcript_62132/m.144546 type:complete len:144 (+) Transcript_62132:31-462(+)
MVSDIVPRAPVCTMLDVGASGSFTVVDEVSGGLLVELEDGRRFVWRWEDGLSSGGGRGLSRTMPAWIQRTRLPEGSLNGAGRGQSHASASAPSLPDGWEGFIDPVTKCEWWWHEATGRRVQSWRRRGLAEAGSREEARCQSKR